MESLRPERDEVDRFNKSRAATRLKSVSADSKSKATKSGGNGFSWLLLVLFVAGATSAGWVYKTQQDKIAVLEKSVSDTDSLLRQSKLMMARFEGALSETGQEMQQSGSAVADKLKFLDSEVRKLWGVSNDRNKKAIAANKDEVAVLQSSLADLKKTLKASDANIQKLKIDLDKQMQVMTENSQEVAKKFKEVSSQVALASSDISITRTELGVQLEELKSSLPDMSKVQSQIDENNTAIKAIDASRVQLNERVVDLETKLNELMLQNKSATP